MKYESKARATEPRASHSSFILPPSYFPMSGNLFDSFSPSAPSSKAPADSPLAERLRPSSLEEIVGLEELLAEGRFLRTAIETDRIPSMIFWGPPGSGKTTLARIIARTTRARFV